MAVVRPLLGILVPAAALAALVLVVGMRRGRGPKVRAVGAVRGDLVQTGNRISTATPATAAPRASRGKRTRPPLVSLVTSRR
jgi:hypothetical protein